MAHYSLTTDPLPQPPQYELENLVANETICTHPDLFEITCNINIKKFNDLLKDHPNWPFIQSVVTGLTKGFWPWAEQQEGYPVTHCEVQHLPKDIWEHDFLLKQCKKEIKVGCFSELFSELLPGMNVVPLHAVPKPVEKLHLVVDHSTGVVNIPIYSLSSLLFIVSITFLISF